MSIPRLNHVAMSMQADALDQGGRDAITAFYGDVFGWEEMPITEDRKRLVMQVHHFEQFVFLVAENAPMACPDTDHFGMSVDSIDELDRLFAKAGEWAAKDPEVNLSDKKVENQHDVVDLHNFYVHYRLPMSVEVQYFDWIPEIADTLPPR